MSQENATRTITLIAGDDLTGAERKFIKLGEDGKAKIAGAGEVTIGVLKYGVPEGSPCTIIIGDTAKVIVGDAIDVGKYVISDAQGRAVESVDGNIVGIALEEASAAGDIIEILLRPFKI